MKAKLVGVVGVVAVVVVGLTMPAFAHVVVEPSTAPGGAEQTFVFRVPNEIDSSQTVKLDVKFPTATPITGVDVEPVPGWTADVKTVTLAKPIQTDDGPITEVVSEITWSGGTIGKGQFQRFPWVGTLPDHFTTLVFPAIQTYANGTVVSWIQPVVAGQPEPDHPTPRITVASAASGATTATTAPAPATAASTASVDAASKSSVNSAKALGIAGLVVGILGLLAAALALARKPRTPTA